MTASQTSQSNYLGVFLPLVALGLLIYWLTR